MPSTKRPLAEADPNSHSSKSAKRASKTNPGGKKTVQKIGVNGKERVEKNSSPKPSTHSQNTPQKYLVRKPNSTYSAESDHEEGGSSNPPGSPAMKNEEVFDYSRKDNSKLRLFLSERYMSTSGDREQLIARLEDSSIDYESLSSGQITEMLKTRHVTSYAHGPKPYKIARLRINDKTDHNTGDTPSRELYGKRSALDGIDNMIERNLEALNKDEYRSMAPKKLSKMLEERGLSTSGSKQALATRLFNRERKKMTDQLCDIRGMVEDLDQEMEDTIGHPVHWRTVFREIDQERADTRELDNQVPAVPSKPVCAYDWKDSHWADKSERQLSEICQRRGMPGYGPKAAMLQWLDTGVIGYDDMYIHGLTRICRERGVVYKASDTKKLLVRRLNEADEAEESD